MYIESEMTSYIQNFQNINDEKEKLKAYIRNAYNFFGYGLWLLIEKETGKIIGECGIQNRDIDGQNYFELEYAINIQSQGKGHATEACYFVLEYLKNELEAKEVIAIIGKENIKSINLIKKLDFEYIKDINTDEQLYMLMLQ
ncbi:MAG: HAD-superfamily hydrolase, subfamily variant 3 [Clostridiales bacterium]|jgi:RimJ/RimL family protein N-acetyltransferase|nr:HAD-superfamily hydrolase, subfamily variant 3 [Clostridiales bacterium]